MRDLKSFKGKKLYYEELEAAIPVIAAKYPKTRCEGSVGAWSWTVDGVIVAEAWLHATRPGWWVRIKHI
jgi:hypothetical protein